VKEVNMMLNFRSILVTSEDPKKLADFYQKVFEKKPDMDEGGFVGFVVGTTFLGIGPHDKVKGKNPQPERVMLNFETEKVKEEFARIKELGAEVIAEPYQMGEGDDWISTFADPDGNYFQIVTPWEPGK